jgi:hypothetical protein
VTIRFDAAAPASCGFFLVVRTRSGVRSLRIPESYKGMRILVRDWPFAEPFLAAVVKLASDRAQIVVAREHGAAVVNVSIYGIVDDRLTRIRFRPAFNQDELDLFGTVGTGVTNAICTRGGPLVLVGEWPTSATGKRWTVARSSYLLRRGVLVRTGGLTVTTTKAAADVVAHRWGMDTLPFTGCVVRRGRRL